MKKFLLISGLILGISTAQADVKVNYNYLTISLKSYYGNIETVLNAPVRGI